MPLTIVTGQINSGKTFTLLGELAKLKSERGRYYVLPSEHTASEFRTSVGKQMTATLGETFVSWRRFINKLASPLSYVLGQREVYALMLSALCEAKLSYFDSSRGSLGTARMFADAVISFKENGVNAEKFRGLIDAMPCTDKERDLLVAFEAYEAQRLKKGLLDSGDVFALALEGISQRSRAASSLGFVAFDEFNCAGISMRLVVSALIKSFPDLQVIISAPSPSDEAAFYASYLSKFRASFCKMEHTEISLSPRAPNRPEISIVKARSHLQESRLVADSVIRHQNLGGLWSDIAVIHRGGPLSDDLANEAGFTGLMPAYFIPPGSFGAPSVNRMLSFSNLAKLPPQASVEEYTAFFGEMIADELESRFNNPGDDVYELRSVSSLERLETAVRAVAITGAITGLGRVGRETYAQLLSDEFSSNAFDAKLERRIDCRLVPFDFGLAFSADTVIMPSMLEGNIPSSSPERAFFARTEDLSRDSNRVIDEVLGNFEDALARDSFIFDSIIAKCRGRILFSYPAVGQSGSESIPSSFLDKFGDKPPFAPSLALAHSQKQSPKELERRVLVELERASGFCGTPEYHGILSSAKAKSLMAQRFKDKAFGATDLEKYVDCPFAYFAEKVLNLWAPDEETPELVPRHRGTISHEALEEFYTNHLDSYKELIADPSLGKKIGPLIASIVEKKVKENPELVKNVGAGLYDMQMSSIVHMTTSVILAEAESARALPLPLFPAICEWAFGFDGTNFLEVSAHNCVTSRIKGKVDRIDTTSDKLSFLVVDYKTGGKVDAVINKLRKGTKLQLPLYVAAVKKFLLKSSNPLGGLLLSTRTSEKHHGFVKEEYNKIHFDVGKKKSTCDENEWDEIMSKAIEASAVYAHSIKHGLFGVEPAEKCSKHCGYKYACRYAGKQAD